MSFPRNIWLLLIQNLAVFIGFGAQALVLNLYLRDIGYREDFLGLVAFTNTVAVGLAALPAGAFSNRFGPRRSLIGGTLVLMFGGMTVAIWTDPIPILLSMCIVGVAQALIFVPLGPYMMANVDAADVPRVFGANFALVSFGTVIGSAVGGLLPRLASGGLDPDAFGYRVALLTGAALSGLGTIAMLAARDTATSTRTLVTTRTGPHPPGKRVTAEESRLRNRLISLIGGNGLLAAATALIGAFFNIYLHDQAGASTEMVGVVYAVGAAATVPASLIAAPLGRRIGTVPVIVLMRLLAVPILLVPFVASSYNVGLVVYTLRSALVSMTMPLDNAYVLAMVPTYLRARIAALRTMSWNVGWALATAVAGAVILRWGYAPIFIAAAACTALSAVIYYVTLRTIRAPPR